LVPCGKSQFVNDALFSLLFCSLTLIAVSGCRNENQSTSLPQNTNTSKGTVQSAEPARAPLANINTSAQNTPTASSPFADITSISGIDFSYSNGRSANEFAIVESLGGGMAAYDFDNDGNIDVMFAGGGRLDNKTITSRPCGLFRNLGGGKFRKATELAHCKAERFFTHGIFPADINCDGFDDLSVSGFGGIQILLNQGDGTFAEQEPLITNSDNAWSSSLAWADFDNNGYLDLYVDHYVNWSWKNHPVCPGQGGAAREVCAPREFAGITDAIFFNDGEFPLRRESESVGLVTNGKGLGVVVGDLNGDNQVDIYVANDTTDNFLYINDGAGKFTESAVLAGVSGDDAGVSTGSMGVFIFDANQDELPDIFVTNFERELSALYRNEGHGLFTFASRQAGFAAYEAGFVGFGTVPVDFDFDGDEDIVVANGHVSYHSPHAPYRQVPLLFENKGGIFRRLPVDGYFLQPHTSRGLATGDFNNDGALDVAFSHLEEPVSLLECQPPRDHHWAMIRLIGTQSNRSAIGASVRFQHDGKTQVRYLCGGGSYLSHSDRRVPIYWPKSVTYSEIEIQWPSGIKQKMTLKADCENIVREAR
jgi:enediyne biosynthesis protein E4